MVAILRISIFVAALGALATACYAGERAGETATGAVGPSTQAAPLAFEGEQSEYYVIAYMQCKEIEALAEEYGTEPVAEPVAKAHALRYGDVPSPGAYQGCLDALEGTPNQVWGSVNWATVETEPHWLRRAASRLTPSKQENVEPVSLSSASLTDPPTGLPFCGLSVFEPVGEASS